ncbi:MULTISPECIES: phage tail assembly protein [unclassified Polaromonas]|nr:MULTISPECIES: phage tail assembly protein [unclassified Polaromonas]HQS39241.1 phage tail assembly protein [Polaromonas sp.]HQS86529.1 phage tail assembly protein [Polaromonas sp.]HQT06839.1 phage tail assembly protein [Polaromonas sp.]
MSENLIKPLKKPWKVGGKEASEIEVRPSTMKDVIAAEQQASSFQPNSFNVQMACLQIVRAGEFTGPFVASHFMGMSPNRFGEIASALAEADRLGEDA